MKITKEAITQFEWEQKKYGTEVALTNLFLSLAKDFLEIKRMRLSWPGAKSVKNNNKKK